MMRSPRFNRMLGQSEQQCSIWLDKIANFDKFLQNNLKIYT